MDQRDSLTWITLELSPAGEERVRDGSLARTLREDLEVGDEFPVFIPAANYSKGTTQVNILLMEGYAFVGSGLEDTEYFKLEKHAYIARVLSSEGNSWKMRVPMTIPDSRIKELRRQLQQQMSVGVSVGDEVKVLQGRFRNLEGVVRGVHGDSAFVEICLRSLEMIASIPRAILEVTKPIGGITH